MTDWQEPMWLQRNMVEERMVQRIDIVTATPYRHPSVLAKTVTTLDVLSGGRA
jgi:hypothetical protein